MTDHFHELSAVCVAFLGTLFLYSGLAKLMSLPSFRMGLVRIPYLPRELLPGLTWAIPITELVIGVCVMVDMPWATAAGVAMLVGFGVVAGIAHHHDQLVPCNCFGVDPSENLSLRTIWRNACFVGIALLTTAVPPTGISLLSGVYGAIAFVLFLAITKAVRNRFEFSHGS